MAEKRLIEPNPVPVAFGVGAANMVTGEKLIVLTFECATGSYTFFFDDESAKKIADQITSARTGLVLPNHKLNGGGHVGHTH